MLSSYICEVQLTETKSLEQPHNVQQHSFNQSNFYSTGLSEVRPCDWSTPTVKCE